MKTTVRTSFAQFSVLAACFAASAHAAQTSCVQCHGSFEWIQNKAWVQMVQDFTNDVHYAAGLSCQDCHGGNPDPKLAEDPYGAMDKAYKPNPYRSQPKRTEIPDFCGRCHSDADYMKRFKPDERVDQLKEYWTSRHGQLLKTGDTNVATCVDCHGTHTIRAPSGTQSRVYPTAVAETCSSCHSNPRHMAGYKTKTGAPLPTDQYSKWRLSVHAQAMFEKDDLSAPTCNDCHGNHGAVPPQLSSITFVCGNCHGREATLFRASPKHKGFQEHNQSYLPLMGKGGCAECHEPPSPSATVSNLTEFSECITCHGNHAVIRPTIAMLGPLPDTPCAYCHEGGRIAGGPAEPAQLVERYESEKRALLQAAAAAGLEGDARFDWLVDQALQLPMHQATGRSEIGPAALGAEFQRFFTKFRIGKTHLTFTNLATHSVVREKVIRCTDCHDQKSIGFQVSSRFADGTHRLAAESARAERTLLLAQRGGVEVRKVGLQLDKAVDSEIQLQVLVHTFTAATNSLFAQKRDQGLQVAQAVLAAGDAGLNEISYRRKGLLVSLGIILCVLVGLALKIRQLSQV
jgi:hypothetical protein